MNTDNTTESTGVMIPKEAKAHACPNHLISEAAKPGQKKQEKQNPAP